MNVVACAEADLPPGGRHVVSVRGRDVLLVRTGDGRVFGVADRCPHQGARLSGGHVSGEFGCDADSGIRLTRIGEVIRCPWHNYAFDLATGRSVLEPDELRVAAYRVSVEDDHIVIDL
jgi:nitrite reductase/ring-hydroxylating ferredoxin subunit